MQAECKGRTVGRQVVLLQTGAVLAVAHACRALVGGGSLCVAMIAHCDSRGQAKATSTRGQLGSRYDSMIMMQPV
jgi:hypothetical protein